MSGRVLDAARGLAQQFVAGVVAERAVDALVIVDIEQYEARVRARELGLRLRRGDRVPQGDEIFEARERVVIERVHERCFALAPVRDVEGGERESGRAARGGRDEPQLHAERIGQRLHDGQRRRFELAARARPGDERVQFVRFLGGDEIVQRQHAQIVAVIADELDARVRHILEAQRVVELREEIDGAERGFGHAGQNGRGRGGGGGRLRLFEGASSSRSGSARLAPGQTRASASSAMRHGARRETLIRFACMVS